MMAAIIGPVIKAHGGTTINYPDRKPGQPDAAEIADRLKIMTKSTVYLSVIFIVISALSLGLFFKFRTVEKVRKEQAATGDGFQPVANYSSPVEHEQ